MGIITRMRKQTAVLWTLQDDDNSSGEPVWDAPVEIPCRWEDMNLGEEPPHLNVAANERVVDPGMGYNATASGELLRYRATAYVDRDLHVGDYLMLGSLSSSTNDDPRAEKSWEVEAFTKIPTFKATQWLRRVELSPSHLVLKDEHARGVEAGTYHRITVNSVSSGGVVTVTDVETVVAVAVRGRPTYSEVQDSGGKYLSSDVVWEIPKYTITDEPTSEDWYEDDLAVRYNLLGWGDGGLSSWWRIFTRRSA